MEELIETVRKLLIGKTLICRTDDTQVFVIDEEYKTVVVTDVRYEKIAGSVQFKCHKSDAWFSLKLFELKDSTAYIIRDNFLKNINSYWNGLGWVEKSKEAVFFTTWEQATKVANNMHENNIQNGKYFSVIPTAIASDYSITKD